MVRKDHTTAALKVFYSYAREDEEQARALRTQLAVLKKVGLIEDWYDQDLLPGEEWDARISQELNAADIILLLISASFLDSTYCWNEMNLAHDRHEAREAITIPIIVKDCLWKEAPFLSSLQVLPKNGKPIVKWRPQSSGWADVVERIKTTLKKTPGSSPVTSLSDLPRESDVLKLTRRLAETFSSINALAHEPVDEVALHQVMRTRKSLPPLLHHWRARHVGVHWLDFAHILLLRRVADLGFPIRFILDDDYEQVAEAAQAATEAVIRHVFRGCDVHTEWYKRMIDDYRRYREKSGEEETNAEAAPFGLHHSPDGRRSQVPMWFKYLIAFDDRAGRWIVYAWGRERAMYEKLRAENSLKTAFIFGGDLTLSGGLGKFTRPGRDLIVEPPRYDVILDWLGKRATTGEAALQLAGYLTLGELETDPPLVGTTRIESFLDRHRPLADRLSRPRVPPDFQRGALALLHAMAAWNDTWFTPAGDS